MLTTPKALRLQIALLGRVNSGKSSFLNLITGQDVSIVSKIEGTTTDVVEKAQELHPFGPVLWLDTAGFGDQTELSDKRLKKTLKVLDRADVVVLVCEGNQIGEIEKHILELADQKHLPVIKIFNKSDLYRKVIDDDGLFVNSFDLSKRDEVIGAFIKKLEKLSFENFSKTPLMLSDLVPENGNVVMIVPIDYEAPQGRLIMPQVQAIRDCLDHGKMVTVVKETEYLKALENLKNKPDLVVCDSQVVKFMIDNTPPDIKCTTFSILMARLKGDLEEYIKGAEAIWQLKDGDKVLIAESCTHHAADDDIGRVKIPNLMLKKTGKKLIFDFVSGCSFSSCLKAYQLIVQCGGCTQNKASILSRVLEAKKENVAITNYGICLSELNGVLKRVVEPFK